MGTNQGPVEELSRIGEDISSICVMGFEPGTPEDQLVAMLTMCLGVVAMLIHYQEMWKPRQRSDEEWEEAKTKHGGRRTTGNTKLRYTSPDAAQLAGCTWIEYFS